MWKDSGIKPQALTRKPKLNDSDRYYYTAFWTLSGSRGQGEAFGPIPQSEYLAYWMSYGINGINARGRFQDVVAALDRDFVSHTHKKRKEELDKLRQQSATGSGGGGRRG